MRCPLGHADPGPVPCMVGPGCAPRLLTTAPQSPQLKPPEQQHAQSLGEDPITPDLTAAGVRRQVGLGRSRDTFIGGKGL